MSNNKKSDKKGNNDQGTGMCIGLALGTAVGLLIFVLTDSILWMPLCLGVGMCLGLACFSGGSEKTDETGSEKSGDAPADEDDISDKQ